MRIFDDIKVISFDLWGTLFDDSAYQRELDEKRIQVCEEITKKYKLVQVDNWMEVLLTERKSFFEVEKRGECLKHKARIKSILSQVNENVSDDVVEEFSMRLDQISLDFIPIVNQQLITLMLEAKADKIPCVILSNTGLISARVTRELLKRTNIYEFFDRIYLSEEVGLCKPKSEFFMLPITDYSVLPSQMLHIGDSDIFDLEAARKVGCRVIKWEQKKKIL